MKQRAQLNIVHDDKQLRYMVEVRDAFTQITNGFYHYATNTEHRDCVQFFRNNKVIDNFNGSEIYNMVCNLNTWSIDERYHTNYYIPQRIDQRQIVVYFPRYSIESFFNNTFSDDNELSLSGIRYIMTTYIYIAGTKVILGSYMFDPRSALATPEKVKYKNMDYNMCVEMAILDPAAITYDDIWKPFRVNVCGELPYTNNTGAVLHIQLEPVMHVPSYNEYASPNMDMYHYLDRNYKDVYVYRVKNENTNKYSYYKRYYNDYGIYKEKQTDELEFNEAFHYTIRLNGEYHRMSEYDCGTVSIPFEAKPSDYLHAKLEFDGDARISILFNEVYQDDIDLYLGETYGLWKVNEMGEYVDENGEMIEPDPQTGMIDENRLVPRENRIIVELVIRDKEDIFAIHTKLLKSGSSYFFDRSEIGHDWNWYGEGLIMVGSVEVYDTNLNNIEEIRETNFPIISIITNEIPLIQDNYRFLVPTNVSDGKRIKIDYVNMFEYNVSVVNKIQKKVIQVTRPEDYKANIIHPVFYRSESVSNIVVHPEVSENIGINLNKYKSKVDIFHIRIEGVDFIETGRTSRDVIFTIDGNLLPGEVDGGTYYILNDKFEMVTSGKYTYER